MPSDPKQLSEAEIVGLTVWAEARNQPIEGEVAVANVIRNRLRAGQWGRDYWAVCLAPKQFSCWLGVPGDKNNAMLMERVGALIKGEHVTELSVDECLAISAAVVNNRFRDNTHGSKWYLTKALFESNACPSWAKGRTPTVTIGDHCFFSSVN
jgi:N-acetylmuramoyl-L-alanine amidase